MREEAIEIICSLPNLKTLGIIEGFSDKDFEALFDSCGRTLKELSIGSLDHIPAALMRENLALRRLKIEREVKFSSE